MLPEGHRTHLCSATFPRDVRALADRVQGNAAHVEGTRLGSANTDIDHLIHLVEPRQKVDAIVNLLLANPDDQTLVFARTRADVADIADELSAAGFAVSSLSGEMDQNARNRALAGFKRGDLRVLVATDVAARGIDVQDIARVIHVDLPGSADTYTHRSGRTGRAGRRGVSCLLAAPSALGQTSRLLRFAGVPFRLAPIPSAADIRDAADQRIFEALTRETPEDAPPVDERTTALAKRLIEAGDVERTIVRLLASSRHADAADPRNVRPVSASPAHSGPPARAPRGGSGGGDWVPFRVSWGHEQGADTRRLLAMVCRRGGIPGKAVGAIHVDARYSVVNVTGAVAEAFAGAAAQPDPRDPRIVIERERPSAPRGPSRPHAGPPRSHAGPPPSRPHAGPPRSHAGPPPSRPHAGPPRSHAGPPPRRATGPGENGPSTPPERRSHPGHARPTAGARPRPTAGARPRPSTTVERKHKPKRAH
jgi:ATP-dependent RNA helicase DeaD